MKNLFFITMIAGILLTPEQTYPLSPTSAAIATGLTTVGIATGSYLIFKHHCKMDRAERLGMTALVTAPLGYIASVLWFGLTPEMRYLFGARTAESNAVSLYAAREYTSAEALLEAVETNYGSYTWLVDLHDDMVRSLNKTRSALRKWHAAREEMSVAEFSWVEEKTYEQLRAQRACLEHNLLLLRRYRPFQVQHNTWLAAHNCHYARY